MSGDDRDHRNQYLIRVRLLWREELLALMRERFLRGDEGEHFDYASRCDNNPKFDDIEQESRDAEERWFDED